jgi:hypothetical protein
MKPIINKILDSDALMLLIMLAIVIPLVINYSNTREKLEVNLGSEIIRGRDTLYITGFSVPSKCYTLSDGTTVKAETINKLIKKDKWKE